MSSLARIGVAAETAVLVYMDVDLSTDLAALLPLVAPLLSGRSDVAIGSRLTRGAQVVRGPKRELISCSYNLLLHAAVDDPDSRVAIVATALADLRGVARFRRGLALGRIPPTNQHLTEGVTAS
jgi:hypothetical protein